MWRLDVGGRADAIFVDFLLGWVLVLLFFSGIGCVSFLPYFLPYFFPMIYTVSLAADFLFLFF